MNDKQILKQLITKYGKSEIEKMINDLSDRTYKHETGTHSVKIKNDNKHQFLIQHRAFGWNDFKKMWNKISTATRNKIYIENNDFNKLEMKLENNRWYILKSTNDPNYPYIIALEDEIIK